MTGESERREEIPHMEVDDDYERDTDIIDDSEVEDETNVACGVDETNPVMKLVSNDPFPQRGGAMGTYIIDTTDSPGQVGEQVGGH